MTTLAEALGLDKTEIRPDLANQKQEIKVKIPLPIAVRLRAQATIDGTTMSDIVAHILGAAFKIHDPDDATLSSPWGDSEDVRRALESARVEARARLKARNQALKERPKKHKRTYRERALARTARRKKVAKMRYPEPWKCQVPECDFTTTWPAAKGKHEAAHTRRGEGLV